MLKNTKAESRSMLLFAVLLNVLPILATYIILWTQQQSWPMFDDFQALIAFAVDYHHLHGLSKFLFIFTVQHDEYKLIFEHIIEAIDIELTGSVHLLFMTILGNLFLLGILAAYWRGYFTREPLVRRLVLFAPITLLVFQLDYTETLDWAMLGLQMLPVICLSLFALELLTRKSGKALLLASIFAIFACFSSANGFILAPVGFLLLLQLRQFGKMLLWTLPFACAGGIYAYRYHTIQRDVVIAHPTLMQKLLFLLSLTGGAVENMHHFPFKGISILLGSVMTLVFIYAIVRKYYQTNPFAFYAAVWFFISAAGVAQVRIHGGLELALTLRYKMYSDFLIVFIYGFLVSQLDLPTIRFEYKRYAYGAALFFSVVLCLSSGWFGYRFLHNRKVRTQAGFQAYLDDPAHNSPEVSITEAPITTGEPEFSRQVTNQAIQEGVYRVPTVFTTPKR